MSHVTLEGGRQVGQADFSVFKSGPNSRSNRQVHHRDSVRPRRSFGDLFGTPGGVTLLGSEAIELRGWRLERLPACAPRARGKKRKRVGSSWSVLSEGSGREVER